MDTASGEQQNCAIPLAVLKKALVDLSNDEYLSKRSNNWVADHASRL
jgi:hypothetical protein